MEKICTHCHLPKQYPDDFPKKTGNRRRANCKSCESKRVSRLAGLRRERQFARLAGQFGEQCNICESKLNLRIDHCHISGKARGILCQKCNVAIGNLADDPCMLQKAIDYLKRGVTDEFFHAGNRPNKKYVPRKKKADPFRSAF